MNWEEEELELKIEEQGLLDEIVTKIVAQGKPAYSKTEVACYYRMPGDPSCRCAAGHLIPDSVYEPTMENKTITGIASQYHTVMPRNIERNIYFISVMQEAHDGAAAQSDDDTGFLKLFLEVAKSIAAARRLEWKH